ncbi:hypothetical protein CAI16_18840 [Virgibacillus dokdonensis]|uniref:Major facilitator superfamily (MFS) profile domain-containing protein n=1 Tax=Virgibacillus dokdonensis TaxID=302167 RepID=A0A3E0WH11_9BACI|nr:MFS transporter [Virgibacillus dokdonensis]RFA32184.1 hypothetical protein CAI16_18840 [Virgibacillus dokdonensis]
MRKLYWFGYLSYLLIGFSTVIFGSVLPTLLEEYQLKYEYGGLLIFFQFLGFLLGVSITPRLIKILKYRKTVACSLLILILVHLLISLKPGWIIVILLAAGNGFGFGTLQTSFSTLLLELVPKKRAVIMSNLEVYFGIGALTMPLLSALLLNINFWNGAFLYTLGLAVLLFFIWLNIKNININETVFNEKSNRTRNTFKLSSQNLKLTILFIIFIFLYVGIETSIINFWPTLIVKSHNVSNAFGNVSVTLFWIAMLIGRLFFR